jgi:outer membrane protease
MIAKEQKYPVPSIFLAWCYSYYNLDFGDKLKGSIWRKIGTNVGLKVK